MIYFHIPFCRHACVYCDFHFNTSLRFLPDLYQALHQEIDYRKAEIPQICESIYFGGGTPSVLTSQQIADLIIHVKQISKISSEA
ncbi:MAG: coproporphyrinogen III oxidase, partial [Bacteroidetes bacterium]|nr:coproporphyrinogen III oxidase [Bacteroidota bacterium]